jgi:hypothetical protein
MYKLNLSFFSVDLKLLIIGIVLPTIILIVKAIIHNNREVR